MITNDPKLSTTKALPRCELLKHATELCNELEELMALHNFFYQAAEHSLDNQSLSFKTGLSIFPRWLRERDLTVLENVHQLQQGLKSS
jgi:hypothetical protein